MDNLWNGTIEGVIIGVLAATSSITFLQSLINGVVGFLPEAYQVPGIGILIFGTIGGIAGYFLDKY